MKKHTDMLDAASKDYATTDSTLSERELLCLKAQALRQYCLVSVRQKQATSQQALPYMQALGLGIQVLSSHKWGLIFKGCLALLKYQLNRR